MAIILVANTDMNDAIGDKDGNLLFKLPKDMKHFKNVTTNKHVVMGRKTWDSLPRKPLPKRKNYILTRDEDFEVSGRTKVLNSVEEVLELAKGKDVYIIGGAEVYKQFFPHADKLIMTHVHVYHTDAHTFFPKIDVKEWKITKVSQQGKTKKYPFTYTFAEYDRKPNTKSGKGEE